MDEIDLSKLNIEQVVEIDAEYQQLTEHQCVHTLEDGSRCRHYALSGNVKCHTHNRNVPIGVKAKTRYGKTLPPSMVDAYIESLADTKMLELRSEIALIDARMSMMLSSMEQGGTSVDAWKRIAKIMNELVSIYESGSDITPQINDLIETVKQGAGEIEAWDNILKLIAERRKLAESERKHLVEQQTTMSIDEAHALIIYLQNSVRMRVSENVEEITARRILTQIAKDLSRVIARESGLVV